LRNDFPLGLLQSEVKTLAQLVHSSRCLYVLIIRRVIPTHCALHGRTLQLSL